MSLLKGRDLQGAGGDPARGAELLGRAAAQGHVPAQLALAEALLSGAAGQDPAKGAEWLARAVQSGRPDVLQGAAILYSRGFEGFPPDREAAFRRLAGVADGGLAEAQYQTAVLLRWGGGTEKNLPLAARYARKAAGQGHAQAQRFLGDCYCRGEGVAKSMKTAFFWSRARSPGKGRSP